MTQTGTKPQLSLWQIVQMNLGFLGLQFSFGLQQSSMSAIYKFLGAEDKSLPLLWLAGPMTGLIVQPIIGAMSDRTLSRWGRRTPYFLIGAIFCSLGLFAMPHSTTLWMAATLLWILDAANNVTMEPYRAYVSDRLNPNQHAIGFLSQSAFTGLAQTLSYIAPTLLLGLGLSNDSSGNIVPEIIKIAFYIGAILSISTICWSVFSVRELPLTAAQTAEIKSKPLTVWATLREIGSAIKDMPLAMRQLGIMCLFQWYGLFCYWQFVISSISLSLFGTADGKSKAFADAVLINGQVGAFYNLIAFVSAFAMVPFTRKLGAKPVHIFCLLAGGFGMILMPGLADKAWLFVPAIGVGLAWGSIMGNPYVMLANTIPPARTGVYMGIFNMFIVIPMLLQTLTMPLYFDSLLEGDARNVLRLGGVLLICAAAATLFIRTAPKSAAQ
jgi:maltose/moltooligosaccharide transporter